MPKECDQRTKRLARAMCARDGHDPDAMSFHQPPIETKLNGVYIVPRHTFAMWNWYWNYAKQAIDAEDGEAITLPVQPNVIVGEI